MPTDVHLNKIILSRVRREANGKKHQTRHESKMQGELASARLRYRKIEGNSSSVYSASHGKKVYKFDIAGKKRFLDAVKPVKQ